MNEIIHLPISENYVKHWGFWEAVRELLQNAIDAKSYHVSKMESSGVLKIDSNGGALDLSTLMLGETTKADDKTCIGKYGEGYKLALLVLCRLGHEVHIKNGHDCWRVSLQEHPQLKSRCLTVEVFTGTFAGENHEDSLSFVICGLCSSHFSILDEKYIGNHYLGDRDDIELVASSNGSYCINIMKDKPFGAPEVTNKVFVGGLFVCNLDDGYQFSYDFAPEVLELDRDRNSVSEFYLQMEATKLLSEAGQIELLVEMANNKTKDVSDYYKIQKEVWHGGVQGYSNDTIKIAVRGFIKKHGEKAYPIDHRSSQESIKIISEKCVSKGLIPVLVKPILFDIIKSEYKNKLDLIEIKGKISDVLSEFCNLNRSRMTSLAKKRLKDIIHSIKIQGN